MPCCLPVLLRHQCGGADDGGDCGAYGRNGNDGYGDGLAIVVVVVERAVIHSAVLFL